MRVLFNLSWYLWKSTIMLCYIGDNSDDDEDDDAFSVGGLESGLEIAAPVTCAGL